MSGMWTVTAPGRPAPPTESTQAARRPAVLAEQVDLVPEAGQRLGEGGVVDVGAGPAQQVAVEDEDAHGGVNYASGFAAASRIIARPMSNAARPTDCARRPPAARRLPRSPSDGVYVDRETGEEMEPVTRILPLAPSDSSLLRTPENLRDCRALRAADRPRPQRLPLLRPAPRPRGDDRPGRAVGGGPGPPAMGCDRPRRRSPGARRLRRRRRDHGHRHDLPTENIPTGPTTTTTTTGETTTTSTPTLRRPRHRRRLRPRGGHRGERHPRRPRGAPAEEFEEQCEKNPAPCG